MDRPLKIKEGIKLYNDKLEKKLGRKPLRNERMSQDKLRDLVLEDQMNLANRKYHMHKWCNEPTLNYMTPLIFLRICYELKVDANFLLGHPFKKN